MRTMKVKSPKTDQNPEHTWCASHARSRLAHSPRPQLAMKRPAARTPETKPAAQKPLAKTPEKKPAVQEASPPRAAVLEKPQTPRNKRKDDPSSPAASTFSDANVSEEAQLLAPTGMLLVWDSWTVEQKVATLRLAALECFPRAAPWTPAPIE